MKLASKMMAVAILALAAGSVSAAATFSQNGPKAADGTLITISLPGAGNNSTVYTFGAVAGVTVTGGSTITTDAGGLSTDVVTVSSTTAGTYVIPYTSAPAGDNGTVSVTFTAIDTLQVNILVTVNVTADIEFVDGGGVGQPDTQTWNLTGATLGTTRLSNAGAGSIFTTIRNNAGADVSVNVKSTIPVGYKWTQVTAAGVLAKNDFRISANALILTSAAVPQPYIATIASDGGTAANVLSFEVPPSVSNVNPGSAITVVYTATVVQ